MTAITRDGDLEKRVRVLNERIADLTQSAKGFERRNKFFEMLISSLPGLFYAFDDKYQVHKWNKNVESVTGYESEEIPHRSIFELFDGDDLKQMQEAIDNVFKVGEGIAEADLITKDGRRIPYLFTGVSAKIEGTPYLLGMGLDISKLKETENAVRESEALYRIFAERMTEGVVLFHALTVLFANDVFSQMLGYSDSKELLGQDIMNIIAKDFEMYFKEMFDSLEIGVSAERYFQARWMTREGHEIWVEGRGNRIRWKGQPAVLLTARDITEVKQREISMQEEAAHLRRENITLRSSIKDRYRFGDIIGKSDAMQEVYETILNSAATNANIIIYGESGTGKELVARAIHDLSSRAEKTFVTVNCAAIPESLVESEFFGHIKGAYTGAHRDKEGYLDTADGGTLFLDEVGELSLSMQAKLLRAIEGAGHSPVGSSVSKRSDFRVIAATNKNLAELSKRKLVREDFFYRIHIIPINLPPLRHRRDDIPLLVEHFLRLYSQDKKAPSISGQVLEALINYDWPGNVRELQNVIQRYLTVKRIDFLKRGVSASDDIRGERKEIESLEEASLNLRDNINNIEKEIIREALHKHRGNKSKAADTLTISRKTLARKMKRLGLS
ncbi:MAG: sigma 54-interacting transcriptional regulator [Deltaproteobacteria bacterium]|nr:sigma 54-interacting transcriptional regulator [Deltaproteobacteria bacterium]MBN2845778.1 sigma 54-interacting transcriptional regulator [Deltaproteobacteria bacterium]